MCSLQFFLKSIFFSAMHIDKTNISAYNDKSQLQLDKE